MRSPALTLWVWGMRRLLPAMSAIFRSYDRVVTSRLHAHIFACLVGTPSILIDNSYGKNRTYFDAWTGALGLAEFASTETLSDGANVTLEPVACVRLSFCHFTAAFVQRIEQSRAPLGVALADKELAGGEDRSEVVVAIDVPERLITDQMQVREPPIAASGERHDISGVTKDELPTIVWKYISSGAKQRSRYFNWAQVLACASIYSPQARVTAHHWLP